MSAGPDRANVTLIRRATYFGGLSMVSATLFKPASTSKSGGVLLIASIDRTCFAALLYSVRKRPSRVSLFRLTGGSTRYNLGVVGKLQRIEIIMNF